MLKSAHNEIHLKCLVTSAMVLPFTLQVFLLGTVMKRVCWKGGRGTHVANQLDYAEIA